jgi:ankyrin repeat protein
MALSRVLVCGLLVVVLAASTLADSSKGTNKAAWRDSDFTTNLWQVISSGNYEELETILSSNPDAVEVRSGDGRGALWWAYEYGRKDMVELLLKNGAKPDERDGDGKTPKEISGNVGATEYSQTHQPEAFEVPPEEPTPSGSYEEDDF